MSCHIFTSQLTHLQGTDSSLVSRGEGDFSHKLWATFLSTLVARYLDKTRRSKIVGNLGTNGSYFREVEGRLLEEVEVDMPILTLVESDTEGAISPTGLAMGVMLI